ncbi:MAG: hypothetical protein GOMPHAMPRED_006740 [Gomphillus americanus]|uniref:Fe2OG dioxygenase domain-containing protein n=1 Tax=Gomphillus americanus TaxID=1940652 RepID=A0A8H3IAS5_9LECA|nr:MAG: hypothetical protein GOMPHAMPRED_006740 [Gomphillus americanus]
MSTPNHAVDYADVPVIDISALFHDDMTSKLQVAKQIDEACRGSGFFYVKNHQVNLAKLTEFTRNFHMTVTDEEKWDLAIRAYNPKHTKQIRNGYYLPVPNKKAAESFCILNPNFKPDHPRIVDMTPLHEVNVWPDESKHLGFKEFQEKYYFQVFDVSQAILRGIALALGKEETFFEQYFKKSDTLSAVSLIRYPYLDPYPPGAVKTAEDGTKLSFEWHYDVSLITVLYQSQVENLQVETPDGWKNIAANDDCYLVNGGTYMEHITQGYYPSPRHRVKWINAERQSLPFFANLGWEDTVPPFSPHGKAKNSDYIGLSYGEYLSNGLQGLINKNGQT